MRDFFIHSIISYMFSTIFFYFFFFRYIFCVVLCIVYSGTLSLQKTYENGIEKI